MKKILALILITIISKQAFAGSWFQVKDWSVPLKVNTVALENMLWDYIKNNSKQEFEPKDSYTYQYKTINENELLINALCYAEYSKEELTRNFVMVDDGGSCYFQATYNFKTHTFVKLVVNGEA
jgi:uridine kinase